MNTIGPTPPHALPLRPEAGKGAEAPSGQFKNVLLESIREVNDMQQQADMAVEKLAAGEEVTPAEVLTAVQKADVAFKLMMQVRNKLVQAYQEIQNVRV